MLFEVQLSFVILPIKKKKLLISGILSGTIISLEGVLSSVQGAR